MDKNRAAGTEGPAQDPMLLSFSWIHEYAIICCKHWLFSLKNWTSTNKTKEQNLNKRAKYKQIKPKLGNNFQIKVQTLSPFFEASMIKLFTFEFQEAIKQVWSLEGNCFRTKGGKEKKEKEMIVWPRRRIWPRNFPTNRFDYINVWSHTGLFLIRWLYSNLITSKYVWPNNNIEHNGFTSNAIMNNALLQRIVMRFKTCYTMLHIDQKFCRLCLI